MIRSNVIELARRSSNQGDLMLAVGNPPRESRDGNYLNAHRLDNPKRRVCQTFFLKIYNLLRISIHLATDLGFPRY